MASQQLSGTGSSTSLNWTIMQVQQRPHITPYNLLELRFSVVWPNWNVRVRSLYHYYLYNHWRWVAQEKWSEVKVTQSCLTLTTPWTYTVHGIPQARMLEWIAFPFSRGSSQHRVRTQVPTLQVDCLPVEPQGKPKQMSGGKKKVPSTKNHSLRKVNCANQGWGVSTSWRFSGMDTTSSVVRYQVGDYIHTKLHFIQDFTKFSITRTSNYSKGYTCHESAIAQNIFLIYPLICFADKIIRK